MLRKVLGATLGLMGAYLFCISPNKGRKDRMKVFEKQYIAHRGLFDNDSEAPENSILAFQKAMEAGYGIELDVQLTLDGKLVVFHDATLKRMCGIEKQLMDCSYDELMNYTLGDSQEKIPLFEDVIKLIDGKVPLIVEVKSEGDWKETTRKMAEMMDDYPGYYCMESFHPFVVKWMKDNRPNVIRGQLSTNYFSDNIERKWYEKVLLSNLMFNFLAKPDFIAYNHKWKKDISYSICRKLFTVENVAWTIKNQQELENAKDTFDIFIFDSFIPQDL